MTLLEELQAVRERLLATVAGLDREISALSSDAKNVEAGNWESWFWSVRTTNILLDAKINSFSQLTKLSVDDVWHLRGTGKTSINEIRTRLAGRNLHLKDDQDFLQQWQAKNEEKIRKKMENAKR